MGLFSFLTKPFAKISAKWASRAMAKEAAKKAGKIIVGPDGYFEAVSKAVKPVGKAAAEGAAKAGTKVISWGNAAKVTLAAGVGFLFFTGGLPKLLSGVTGLPEWASQLIIAAVIIYLALTFIKMAMYRARRAVSNATYVGRRR